MFDRENECQREIAQHPQRRHSMANSATSATAPFDGKYQLLQKTLQIVALSFTMSEISASQIFYYVNLGQGRGVQLEYKHSQGCHLMASIDLYKSQSTYFYASSKSFQDINVSKV